MNAEMEVEQDKLERRINDYARRSFRDIADGDYIAARLACRNGLMPQFLWLSQQAIEKYLKYILLVNRIPAKDVGHNIEAAIELTERLEFKIDLRQRSRNFLQHIATYGESRYLDVSYFLTGHILVDLDVTIWDLRRYAQVLEVFGKVLPTEEEALLAEARSALLESRNRPPQHFHLDCGLLEKVISDKHHPAREALIWQNPCFGSRARRTVTAKRHMHAQNAPLYLYPDMINELDKYVRIPKKLRVAYQKHLADVTADPSRRP